MPDYSDDEIRRALQELPPERRRVVEDFFGQMMKEDATPHPSMKSILEDALEAVEGSKSEEQITSKNDAQLWTKERGYSSRLQPFLLYGAAFGGATGLARWMGGGGYPPPHILGVVVNALAGAIVGFCFWCIVRGWQGLRRRLT